MKKLIFLFIFLLLFPILSLKSLAKETTLHKKNLFLSTLETSNIKLKNDSNNLKKQLTSQNPKIVSINKNGIIKGLRPGKTYVYINLYKGSKLSKTLRLLVTVKNTGLAKNQKDLNALLKMKDIEKIFVKSKFPLYIPAGNFTKELHLLSIKELEIKKKAFLYSIFVSSPKKVKIKNFGHLGYVYNNLSTLSVSNDGEIDNVNLDGGNNIFISDSVNPMNFHISNKVQLTLSGTLGVKDTVLVDNSQSSYFVISRPINFYTNSDCEVMLKTGGEDSVFTTLDYNTKLSITNSTKEDISITTPAGNVEVSAGTTSTVSSKKVR